MKWSSLLLLLISLPFKMAHHFYTSLRLLNRHLRITLCVVTFCECRPLSYKQALYAFEYGLVPLF
jgi:hypothetical protein